MDISANFDNQQCLFNSHTKYIFVNQCLHKIYNCKLPSFCYYTDNDDLDDFWSHLSNDDYKTIYEYLVDIKIIKDVNNSDYKQIVLDFVTNFFIDD